MIRIRTLLVSALLCHVSAVYGGVNVVAERHGRDEANPAFKFPTVPAPVRGDAAAKAKFTLIDGERDPNGGDLAKLNDGRLPRSSDEPSGNFFFRAGTDGGRILIDLGALTDVRRVSSYSWHGTTRAAQVYRLFGSDGTAAGFDPAPKRPLDPEKAGWTLLANVDSRAKENPAGEQHGVHISASEGKLASARYLLLDLVPTETADPFGNTFYSEIDVLDREVNEAAEQPAVISDSVEIEGTEFRFTVDTTEAPDLTEWTRKDLIPVMKAWYPKIVEMLPSDGYAAPRTFSITFTDRYRGVAATAGNRIECSPAWYRQNLKGEAIGSLVHELVHVVQQYRGRRNGGSRPPGWLVEGIPDYIRWYLYEPQSKGAEIRPGNVERARYDGSYRVSANFLNWVVAKYDKELIKELNAAMRAGRYDQEIWKSRTGKPVEELAEEWKKALKGEVPAGPGA